MRRIYKRRLVIAGFITSATDHKTQCDIRGQMKNLPADLKANLRATAN